VDCGAINGSRNFLRTTRFPVLLIYIYVKYDMHNRTISLCDIICKYSLVGKQNS
jgi:hypothetical protein